MTNNVKEIHDWLMEDRLKKQSSSGENPTKFTPHSEKEFEDLSEEAIPTKSINFNFKKGEKVTIIEYGICTFEGVWEGKYAFYPENKTNLPNSPYLVKDVEPYLLIPKNRALAYRAGGEVNGLWNAVSPKENIIKNAGYNYEIEPSGSVSFGYTLAGENLELPEKFEIVSKRENVTDGYEVQFDIYDDWGDGFQGADTVTNTGN